MDTFIEQFTYFTRWLTILSIGAPLSALLSCLAGRRFAHNSGAQFEFSDALLFSAAGGLVGPPLAAAIAFGMGALGTDAGTSSPLGSLLVDTAILGLVLGAIAGVPLGFVAAWDTLRRTRDASASPRPAAELATATVEREIQGSHRSSAP